MILRETQNQNDADDANDAESGIWYRDILKTASLASSASLSSHKSSAGVWGTPQKCACGWPHAMLAKHVYPQNDGNLTRQTYKFVHSQEWITSDSSKNLDSKKWIGSDSRLQWLHYIGYRYKRVSCIELRAQTHLTMIYFVVLHFGQI